MKLTNHSNRGEITGAALITALVMAAPGAVRAAPLTPVQVYRQALSQNPAMMQSRAQIAEAKGAVREARGHLLPKLSLKVTGSGSDNPLNVFGMKLQQQSATFNDFGANQFSLTNPNVLNVAPDNLDNPPWYRNYQTQLQVGIPVYNGGQVWGGLHQAQSMLAAAQAGNAMARQKLLFETLKLYEGLRTAGDYVKAAHQGLQAADAYVSLTQKLYRHGAVDKSDVLRAEVHRGDARLALAKAQEQQAVAREGLRVLLGRNPGTPVRLAPGTVAMKLPAGDVAALQRMALADNPGLTALNAQTDAARAAVSQAKAAYLPHVNLMLAREWNDTKLRLDHPTNTVAGVLSWDLLDFGSRGGALDRADAKVIQQQGKLREVQDQLRVKVQQGWQQVKLAQVRIETKQAAVAEAAEAARLSRLRYAQGVDTLTQLLAAQAALDKARADLVSAHYQAVTARAGLLLALGRLQPATVTLTTEQPSS